MMTRSVFRLFALLVGLCAGAGAAQAEQIITLRPSTSINGSMIRLSDVFSGVPEAIDRDIARAPQPGKSVTYDVRILSNLSDQYRLDWHPESVADKAVLTRASVEISSDMIRDAIVAKLTAPGAENRLDGRVEIAFDGQPPELNLPADRGPDFALKNFSFDPLQKRFRSDVVAQTGRAPLMIVVSGRATVWREIPVLAKHIDVGVSIGKNDIDYLSLPDTRLQADTVTDASALIGQSLRHETQPGQPLRNRDITPPRLVTRGDLVTLKVETPLMLVTAQGRALIDGVKGETIRVINTQSNRMIEGVVEAPGIIRIQTNAQRLTQADATRSKEGATP